VSPADSLFLPLVEVGGLALACDTVAPINGWVLLLACSARVVHARHQRFSCCIRVSRTCSVLKVGFHVHRAHPSCP
jgi:hypothetical protein